MLNSTNHRPPVIVTCHSRKSGHCFGNTVIHLWNHWTIHSDFTFCYCWYFHLNILPPILTYVTQSFVGCGEDTIWHACSDIILPELTLRLTSSVYRWNIIMVCWKKQTSRQVDTEKKSLRCFIWGPESAAHLLWERQPPLLFAASNNNLRFLSPYQVSPRNVV